MYQVPVETKVKLLRLDFKKHQYSQLIKKLSLEKKFPPMKKAWDIIGHLKLNNKKINILNGVHDSNASYLYFLKSKDRKSVV